MPRCLPRRPDRKSFLEQAAAPITQCALADAPREPPVVCAPTGALGTGESAGHQGAVAVPYTASYPAVPTPCLTSARST